ncbi:PREDICTED: uncharacterized protein LOC106302206 [Brassica oleracea var. oleracea]|uniref:uncharacterized protein LOC106302206 n=1 Tax=Brassica oleracea var. oleracea TaxID=109376 RepID=UPI0006A6E62D|nr:PREDICTED: uncharacterized protein LOC106302206 [Brassica oleracea var. oleracea]
MMKTTKVEEELVQAKMRREITKLDDEELWAEFEPLEIDRIESGEIKPKTLITNCGWFHSPQFRERGPLIVKEMLSVFPNSTYIKWKRRWIPNSLKDLIRIAKERECTSLVLVDTNPLGHDEICIVSLLNGAAAYFRIFNLIPREDIPLDQATPPTRLDPYVRMARFASQAGLGLSRLIQSLFPKVTHSRTNKPCQKNLAFFQYQDGFVFYRHHWLHSAKAALSEERPKHTRKEVGPRFQLLFKGVKKVSLDTGSLKLICMPPASHYDYPERQLMMPPI